MIDHRKLDKLLNAGIVAACVSGLVCSAALWAEMGQAAERLEWSRRVTEAPAVSYFTLDPGEDPAEDVLIEESLLEQGYFRDDVPLSYDLQDTLHTACEEFGVRYELALAVIERESDFTNITGDGGESVGYFQIQPRWWGDLMAEIGVDDLADPAQNCRSGCAILARLIGQYGNERDALTCYNSGHPGESEYAAAVLEAAGRWAA